ncbi:MAG: hypothetical protein IMY71_05900 [Bacteroidetes bacterium]|nr:hypothetical protein [Bacteroidota bacterium]
MIRKRLFILVFSTALVLLHPFYFLQDVNAKLKVGETLKYDVTFGNLLKGYAEIKFYGKITSYAEYETLTVPLEEVAIDSTLKVLSDSMYNALTDSTIDEALPDLLDESQADSMHEEKQDSIKVIKTITTNIYYITYDTKFIGNIYNLHADIYARDDFFPLLIETKIRRTGKVSRGRELFYPDKNMAIFSQIIEGEEEVDTLLRKHPLQDVTTIPFYFMGRNFGIGDFFNISLPQGEFKLTCIATERIETGEGFDFKSYNTYRIESNPEGFKVWLNKKDKVPIKVYMKEQKIKMLLKKKKIDASIKTNKFNEARVKAKLIHLFPNN